MNNLNNKNNDFFIKSNSKVNGFTITSDVPDRNRFWGLAKWEIERENFIVKSKDILHVRKDLDEIYELYLKETERNGNNASVYYSILPVNVSYIL